MSKPKSFYFTVITCTQKAIRDSLVDDLDDSELSADRICIRSIHTHVARREILERYWNRKRHVIQIDEELSEA